MKKKLLWVGDAVVSTGFARATHKICDVLLETYDIHVLGINYHGDPHMHPYQIYPAWHPGQDAMGWNRMRGVVDAIEPDVIVLQNDPWNIQGYLRDGAGSKVGDIPVVGFIAIDGKNPAGAQLNGLALAIFWTRFAEEQAKLTGYKGLSTVVPLGVDTDVYHPQDRAAVRARMQTARMFADRGAHADSFVVGCVGRNQWRKRLDLVIEYFAEWIHTQKIDDAFLWLHSAPTFDRAWDLDNLAAYYGVKDRVLIPRIPGTRTGFQEEQMARCYAMFDVMFTATLGEGFWLPGFEAAACGTSIIAPDWSAVGELFKDAAMLVHCSATAVHPSQTNTIGGVMDKAHAIETLNTMYRNTQLRATMGRLAFERANEPRFRWEHIGRAFRDAIDPVVNAAEELGQAWASLDEVPHGV